MKPVVIAQQLNGEIVREELESHRDYSIEMSS